MSACYACGKPITEDEAYARIKLSGEVYLLCCPMCLSSLEAGRVQRLLVPSSFSDEGVDVFVEYAPAHQIGGDYACIRYSPRGKLYLVIGDVSGHGITSSLLMSRLSSETERLIGEDRELPSIAETLNAWMHTQFGEEGLYVTLFAATIGLESGTLRYVNCGHPSQRFWSSAQKRYFDLEPQNLPVGLFPNEKFGRVEERRLDTGQGDKLMLFTDGLLELWTEHENEDTAEEHLVRAFGRFIERPIEETVQATVREVASLRGSSPPDDVLLVLVNLKGLAPEAGAQG